MNKILMPMLDGGIANWEDDREYVPGCPTCDYGSEYINNITITMTKMKIRVCGPCLSEIKDNFEWRGVQKEDGNA